ncbi:hypothetical protein CDL15_Pgr026760 [Punica granatum]|uniref:Uncharacterized protein n=1 Tax=Punica granatum TaxID=22663 RepID=A0A218WMT4_PUNGR|nr:hypothetical protein CDL15_Pgr026760 [Punica granatum]
MGGAPAHSRMGRQSRVRGRGQSFTPNSLCGIVTFGSKVPLTFPSFDLEYFEMLLPADQASRSKGDRERGIRIRRQGVYCLPLRKGSSLYKP